MRTRVLNSAQPLPGNDSTAKCYSWVQVWGVVAGRERRRSLKLSAGSDGAPKDSYCAIRSVDKGLFSLAEDVQAEAISVSLLKNTHWGANVCVENVVSSVCVAAAALTFESAVVILFIYSFSACSGLHLQSGFRVPLKKIFQTHNTCDLPSRAGASRNKSEELLGKIKAF